MHLLPPAIATTAITCPAAIRPSVVRLSARLERENYVDALRRFADELDDPAVTSSPASSSRPCRSRATPPTSCPNSPTSPASESIDANTVEAERAGTRMDMRIIVGVCAVAVVAIVLFARSEFLEPYRSATGQAVLAGIFIVFIAAVIWARRLATYKKPPRFLTIRSQQ